MSKNFSSSKNNRGFGIIEALIGVLIGGLLLMAFSFLVYQTIKINRVNSSQIKAMMYLQEMIEVAKDLEQDPSWAELNNCPLLSHCHPVADANFWKLETGDEFLEEGNYTRWLVIERVCRDTSKKIVSCPGDEESSDTKKITAEITWNDGFQMRTSQLETYVYKY